MKKRLLTILITMIVTALAVLTLFEIRAQQRQLEADVLVELNSEILEEKRDILIHLPREYDLDKKYPVLYVLDGSSQDFRMAGILEILNIARTVPELIVVGIPNTDRNRDLTPHYILQNTDGEIYGEGDKFLSFIRKEVIPYIESNYPTTSYKMLAGHSRAGLFSFYAFLEQPAGFDAYFCFSPAFWRDNSVIVKHAKEKLPTISANPFVYLSLGTEENQKMKRAYDLINELLDRTNRQSFVHQYTPEAYHGDNLFYSTPIALRRWADWYVDTIK